MFPLSGTTSYQYDDFDRLRKKMTPFGTLTYSYTLNGNIQRIQSSNPGGTDLTYDWDQQNRLEFVNKTTAAESRYVYDISGNLGSVTYPNGVLSTNTYTEVNR